VTLYVTPGLGTLQSHLYPYYCSTRFVNLRYLQNALRNYEIEHAQFANFQRCVLEDKFLASSILEEDDMALASAIKSLPWPQALGLEGLALALEIKYYHFFLCFKLLSTLQQQQHETCF